MTRHLGWGSSLRAVPVVLGVLVLSGCAGEEAQPGVLAEVPAGGASPAETTASASPSAEEVPIPVEARAHTPEGAAAFVEHWFDVLNRAVGSGSTTELRSVSAGDCETCSNFVQSIESHYAIGGRLEGGEWRLNGVAAQPVDGSDSVVVSVEVDVTDSVAVSRNGKLGTPVAGSSDAVGEIGVRWSGDGWETTGFRLLSAK